MKSKQPALILALLAFAALALWAQTTQRTIPSTGGTSPSAVNANPQSRFIRILTPVASQKLATNIVRVSFEVTNPGVSGGMPNFLVQLDGNDPVRTTSTDYTFTGLAPGNHSVTIIMVDANETPIPGARSVVQFNILPPRSTSAPPAARPGGMAYNTDAPIVRMASVAGPPIDGDPQNEDGLPSSGGALPLLSVIGFGVLLGGVASAMRTR